MKNLQQIDPSLRPLTNKEKNEVNGGFVPLLIVGAALLLAGCSRKIIPQKTLPR